MNWKEYILQLKFSDELTGFGFQSPIEYKEIQDLKTHFSLDELPGELEELYKQINGVQHKYEETVIGDLIWPVEKLIEMNREYRSHQNFKDLYMSFDQLLFFSDAGNGDCFAFVTLNGRFNRSDIFVWSHEDDSRTWVAPNLKIFIERWLSGNIKV
jgi:hypothetical protein